MARPDGAAARHPLEGIFRTARRLATDSDPLTALPEYLHEVMAVTGAIAAGIFVSDRTRGLVPLITTSPDLVTAAGTLPGKVAASSQPLQVGKAVGVPVRDGQGHPGALVLVGQRDLQPGALPTASIFADLISAALRLSRAQHEAQLHRHGVTMLAETGRSFAGLLDLPDLLGRILDRAERLLGAVGGFVCLIDEETGSLRVGLFRWISREAVVAVMGRPGFAAVLREPEPRLVPDAGADPVYSPLADGVEERVSLVSIPLRAERAAAGLLVAVVPDPSAIEPEHLSLAGSFADQAALAVVGTDLYAAVGRKEAEMSAVVASLDNPVIVVDPAGRFLTINPAAEHVFNLSGTFDRGKPAQGRLEPPELEEFLLSGWGVREFELTWPAPRTYRASTYELRDRGQEVIGRVMVLVDLTSERQTEQMKSDFMSVIGHELRTPITVIKGFVRTLQKRGSVLAEEVRVKTLERIASQTLRLERLIEDLLLVSQVETSRAPLFLEETNLVELARRVLVDLKDEWPDRRLHLETTHPAVSLVADATKVEQVLRHLVENGLKYSNDDVRVRLHDEGAEVHIEVVDRGIGIFSGDIPKLFRRFGQIESAMTREQGGTGMGLYISRRLVEVHGGRIWVDSQLGQGSTFHVALPRAVEESEKNGVAQGEQDMLAPQFEANPGSLDPV